MSMSGDQPHEGADATGAEDVLLSSLANHEPIRDGPDLNGGEPYPGDMAQIRLQGDALWHAGGFSWSNGDQHVMQPKISPAPHR
jgi:hypothetical protein